MTLSEIKSELGYSKLNLNTANDKAGNPTFWMRHWDNSNRVAVSIHKDLVGKLATNGDNLSTLGLQTEDKEGPQGHYTAYRIVEYAAPEVVL